MLVSYQNRNWLRFAIILLNQFNLFRIPLGVPSLVTPTGGAGGATGSNLADGTYYYKATAIDAGGRETPAGNEVHAAVAGGTTNNQETFGVQVNETGAASYRLYRGTAAGAQTGYIPITTTQWAAGFIDDGNVSLTTGTPPAPVIAGEAPADAAYYTPLQDSLILNLTTVVGLFALITGAKVSYQHKNFGRKLIDALTRLTTVSGRFPIPPQPTATGVGSGSTYGLGSGTVYYKVAAIDDQGRESLPGPERSFAVTNQNSVTIGSFAVTGSVKRRIYRGTTSGGQNVYFDTASTTLSDTGAAGTAGTPVSTLTSNAGPAVLTDAVVTAADTFAGLKTAIAGATSPAIDTSLSAGEQSE